MKTKNIFFIFGTLLFLSLFLFSFISAGELRVTEEHPFLVDGGWISASQLRIGDILQTVDGKKVRITSLEDIVSEENFSVYNLEAKEYSDFVVSSDNLIVHNSNKGINVISINEEALNANAHVFDTYEGDGVVSSFFGVNKARSKYAMTSGEYLKSLEKTRGLTRDVYLDDISLNYGNDLAFISHQFEGLSFQQSLVIEDLLLSLRQRKISLVFSDDFARLTGAGGCFSAQHNAIVIPKEILENPKRFLEVLGHEYYHSLPQSQAELKTASLAGNLEEYYVFSRQYQRMVRLDDVIINVGEDKFVGDVAVGTTIKISARAAQEINSEVFAKVFVEKVFNPEGENFIWPEYFPNIFHDFASASTHSHLGWGVVNSKKESIWDSANFERLFAFEGNQNAYLELRPPISHQLEEALNYPEDISVLLNQQPNTFTRNLLESLFSKPITRAYQDPFELMQKPIIKPF